MAYKMKALKNRFN